MRRRDRNSRRRGARSEDIPLVQQQQQANNVDESAGSHAKTLPSGKSLLQAAKNKNFADAAAIVDQLAADFQIDEFRDDTNHKTAAHYCALSPMGHGVLKNIVRKFGSSSLQVTDVNGETAMHLAARVKSSIPDGDAVDGASANESVAEVMKLAGWERLGDKNKWGQLLLHILMEYQSSASVREVISDFLKAESFDANIFKQTDFYGNTSAHYAARLQNVDVLKLMIDKLNEPDFLLSKNKRGETAMMILIQYQSADFVKSVSSQLSAEIFSETDCRGYTAAHYAACNETDDNVLQLIVERLGLECLAVQNKRKVTPLQLMLQHRSEQFVRKIISDNDFDRSLLTSRDSQLATSIHYAASNLNNGDVFLLLSEILGTECLAWRNNAKQTALHLIMLHQKLHCVEELAKTDISSSLWIQCDNYGNTAAHFAARNRAGKNLLQWLCSKIGYDCLLETNFYKKSPLNLLWSQEGCDVNEAKRNLLASDSGKSGFKWLSAIQEACMQNQFKFLSDVCDLFYPNENFFVQGNTFLHYLFAMHGIFDDEQLRAKIQSSLIDGCDPRSENELHCTCLQVSRLCSQQLCNLLANVLQPSNEILAQEFKKMLTNSQGLHALHALAGRYDLVGDQGILEHLAELSNLSTDELLKLKVADGKYKGATCLHFVCMEGHTSNFAYLFKLSQEQGFNFSARTASGKSFVDVANDKGKLSWLIAAADKANLINIDFLRVIDLRSRALNLPDKERASKELDAITGAAESLDADQLTQLYLLRALESDSSSIIRCLLSLDLLPSKVGNEFGGFLVDILQNSKLPIETTIDNSTKLAQNFVSKFSDKLPVTLLTTAAHFKKVNIIPDLLLIHQFDLIPASIQLLLQLKKMVKQHASKYEQLRELQEKVTTIVANAMDYLLMNAEPEQKQLLFRYLAGQIQADNEPCSCGPKFCLPDIGNESTRSGTNIQSSNTYNNNYSDSNTDQQNQQSLNEMSILGMIDQLDSEDLFGTECVYKMAHEIWTGKMSLMDRSSYRRKYLNLCFSPSPRWKMRINCSSFIIFLILFSWFIIDFHRTLSILPGIRFGVLLAFALSYSMQELNDFWQRRHKVIRFCSSRVFSLPAYFRDWLNILDVLAISVLWLGIGLYFSILCSDLPDEKGMYGCQIIFSFSFLLWGFRSLALLNVFELTGPVNSMLRKLVFHDLMPFLVILFVIFYSFGLFFLTLLFPTSTTGISAQREFDSHNPLSMLKQILHLPALLLFGIFEQINFQASSNGTEQNLGSLAHPIGLMLFNNLFVFVFLALVSIVMMNLLIALFNLTVTRISGQAKTLWRQKYFELVLECDNLSVIPPPLSFVCFICIFIEGCVRAVCEKKASCTGGGAKTDDTPVVCKWWRNDADYDKCTEFMQFLRYQAMTFRQVRPLLSRSSIANRGEFQQLRASNENALADVQQEIIAELDGKIERLSETIARQNDETDARIDGKIEKMEERIEKTDMRVKEIWYSVIKKVDERVEQGNKKIKMAVGEALDDRLKAANQTLIDNVNERLREKMKNYEEKLNEFDSKFEQMDANILKIISRLDLLVSSSSEYPRSQDRASPEN